MQWTLLLVLGSCALCMGAAFGKDDDVKEISIHSLENDDSPRILPVRIESSKKRKSTGDILRHLGMTKMKTPGNHHRKRLASQSRKSHSGDSHMYVVKLPANPYYYDPEPTKGVNVNSHNVNHIPVNFKSNGKPGKIYHWNLPVVKKMVARKTSAKSKNENQIFKPTLWGGEEPHKKISFYKPKKPSKQAFRNYFAGNGKPHALYIIENKKRTNVHRIKE